MFSPPILSPLSLGHPNVPRRSHLLPVARATFVSLLGFSLLLNFSKFMDFSLVIFCFTCSIHLCWRGQSIAPSKYGFWDSRSNYLQEFQCQLNEHVTQGPKRKHLCAPWTASMTSAYAFGNVTDASGYTNSTSVLVLHLLFLFPCQWLLKIWISVW